MSQKHYKLKPDVIRVSDPSLCLIALVFEATKITVTEELLKTFHPVTQFLFEECPAPKKLTKKKKGDIN